MRRFLALVLGALVISVLPGLPAQAATPGEGSTFNVPRPWGTNAQRYRIINKVVSAVRSTAPSATDPRPVILITSYLWKHGPSTESLIEACKRGVDVRVILDGAIDNRLSRKLVTALTSDQWVDRNGDGKDDPPRTGACGQGDPVLPAEKPQPDQPRETTPPDAGAEQLDTPLLSERQAERVIQADADTPADWGPDGSYVVQCQNSCRGGPGNMHTKFYAFSSSGSARNVVMVSSSNLNHGGALNGWNDMYTMTNRPATFRFYQQIHEQMTKDRYWSAPNGDEIVDGPYTSRFFPMRNGGKGNDPTLQDLNRIGCQSSFGRTKVFVSMFYWKGTRGDYLATKLLQLARAGCRVNIIYGAPSRAIADRLRKAAKVGRITLYDSRWDKNRDGYNEVRTHAKYVLVKGTYAGNRSAHVVMTGSSNWVMGSLRNSDESTLNIETRPAYNQYVGNWVQIRKHSRRLPYSRYRR